MQKFPMLLPLRSLQMVRIAISAWINLDKHGTSILTAGNSNRTESRMSI